MDNIQVEENNGAVSLSPDEAREFDEFKRQKRIAEAHGLIRRLELDFTQIQAERTSLRRVVKDAEKLGLGGICVTPYLVNACKTFLGANSPVAVVACLSESGADVTDIKVKQVKRAVKDGAAIAEVTAPVCAIKEGSWGYVKRQLKKLKKAAKKAVLRINLQAPLLTAEELTKLCLLACDCNITCVCTASENYGGGADEKDLKIIKAAIKDRAAVKAGGADSAGALYSLTGYGAAVVGSPAAISIAISILKNAEG